MISALQEQGDRTRDEAPLVVRIRKHLLHLLQQQQQQQQKRQQEGELKSMYLQCIM